MDKVIIVKYMYQYIAAIQLIHLKNHETHNVSFMFWYFTLYDMEYNDTTTFPITLSYSSFLKIIIIQTCFFHNSILDCIVYKSFEYRNIVMCVCVCVCVCVSVCYYCKLSIPWAHQQWR